MSGLTAGPTIVHADDVAPQPWKNGGGVTRELLRLPLSPQVDGDATDDWLLRISLADIEADGPFSPFPGITRWFAVIGGAGVRLRWPDGRADRVVAPGTPPLRFDGADAPACDLVAGRTRDLNVMVRADAGHASLVPIGFDEARGLGRATAFGVFTLRAARLHGAAPRPLDLPGRTLAWCAADKSATRAWWLEAPRADAGAMVHTATGERPAPVAFAIDLHTHAAPAP